MRAKIDDDISKISQYFPVDIGNVKVQYSEATKNKNKLTLQKRNKNTKIVDDRELLEKRIE